MLIPYPAKASLPDNNLCLNIEFPSLSITHNEISSPPLLINKPKTLLDTDGDGVPDLVDIDDDNDGIPDVMEQYCSNSSLANSNSGSGAYQDNIYWFNWTDADFSDGLQDGDSQTFVLSSGTTITATISNVVNLGNQGGDRYVADDINTWSGARIHYLYNTAGTKEVFHSGGGNADDVSFDISFIATKNGLPQYLDYILVDGESTNGSGEYVNFVTDGGNWTALENYGSGAVYTGLGTQTINISNTESSGVGNTVFYTENAQNFSIALNSAGGQAVGFGIYLECDTDNDGIFNHLDLDSDNDGIPDIVEAGGADENGDGRVDTFTDSDGDGLADVFETSDGSSSSLFDTDGDGTNEINGDFDGDQIVNWKDLDSDGDGMADINEVGGADTDVNSLIDGSEFDTDHDGFADGVDGDVGNDGTSENSANSLLLTTADTDLNGQPDLGYSQANTDSNGASDFLDIDADDDGIVDNTELQSTVEYIAPTGSDDDQDGLDNSYDNNLSDFGGKALIPVNTDGDAYPDFQDLDSDEDLLLDAVEGHDLDGDFYADSGSPSNLGTFVGTDIDGDGLDDGFDNDNTQVNPTNSGLQPSSHPNFYGNGDRDWRALQTLQIESTDFQANWQRTFISLTWTLKKSETVKHIEILRKIQKEAPFKLVGMLPSKTDSLYQFEDKHPLQGESKEGIYYQLRLTRQDGHVSYSKILKLSPNKEEFGVKVSSIPGSGTIMIRSAHTHLGKLQIRVFDLSGEPVYQNRLNQNNKNSLSIYLGYLSAGIYILKLRNGLGEKSVKLHLD